MRYVSKEPREGINVSDTHPLVEAGTLVVGLTAIFVAIVIALIFLVEIVLFFIPPEKEAALFGDWLPDDLIAVSPDDERLYQTQMLADRLAAHWEDAPYEFRIEIDDAEIANAMALPGGLIIVTQGLLDQVESENELAFVLGHELGHYRNRDHLRALGRAVVLSIFFAVTTGKDVSGLSLRISDLALAGFSRKQESSADEFGLAIVYAQYGHLDEAWRLFERWDDGGDSLLDVVSYLSTHPQPDDRVDDLEAIANREGWPVKGSITALPW